MHGLIQVGVPQLDVVGQLANGLPQLRVVAHSVVAGSPDWHVLDRHILRHVLDRLVFEGNIHRFREPGVVASLEDLVVLDEALSSVAVMQFILKLDEHALLVALRGLELLHV